MRRTSVFLLSFIAFASPGCIHYGNQVEHANVAFDISPDGQTIVFSAADGDLYLLRPATRQVSALTKSEATESNPSFSPDGKAVIFSVTAPNQNGSSISVLTLDDTRVRILTSDPDVKDDFPSFSPDGSQIVFIRASLYRPYSMGGMTWDNHDVYVMNRDGTSPRRVTSGSYYQALRPRFIDGGKVILFSADERHPSLRRHLFTASVNGSEQPRWLMCPPTTGGDFFAWGDAPSISAGGKRIAFVSDRSNHFHYDVYTSNPDGSKAHPLHVTRVSRYNMNPVFLPDDRGLLFLAGTEQNAASRYIFSLWEVGLDGANPKRVAESDLFTDPLRWAATTGMVKPTAEPPMQ